jgi:hypothetical protein
MKLQILQDNSGKEAGVFLPIEDWNLIKRDYPEIEELISEIPIWEQNLIDNRLDQIAQNSERILDGEKLIEALKNKL